MDFIQKSQSPCPNFSDKYTLDWGKKFFLIMTPSGPLEFSDNLNCGKYIFLLMIIPMAPIDESETILDLVTSLPFSACS